MAGDAGGGRLPQLKAARARLGFLVFFLPLYFLEIFAIHEKRSAEFLLGVALWFAARVVATALTLTVGAALGGQFLWLRIGMGPRLSRSVIGNQVRAVHLLPIVLGGLLMPKEESFARTHRIFAGCAWLLPVLLAGAVAPMLPGYSALVLTVLAAATFLLTAISRDAVSGRSLAARVLVRPTQHNSPTFTRPDRIRAARSACIDVQFGDLGEAESVLAGLCAEPGAGFGAAMLAAELLAARGDYDGALRVRFPEPDPEDAKAVNETRQAIDSARAAKLLMLLAEQDPTLAPGAATLARRHVAAVAQNGFARQGDRTGRALLAIEAGNVRVARRENRICAARARTPLAIVDALCTQARIEALRDRPKRAAKALDEAEKLAPWYPRITTVRQIAGAGAAAAMPQPILAAQTDTSHVFAEPWFVSTPTAGPVDS